MTMTTPAGAAVRTSSSTPIRLAILTLLAGIGSAQAQSASARHRLPPPRRPPSSTTARSPK